MSGGMNVRDSFHAVTIDFEGHVFSRQPVHSVNPHLSFKKKKKKTVADFGLPELICTFSERHIFGE